AIRPRATSICETRSEKTWHGYSRLRNATPYAKRPAHGQPTPRDDADPKLSDARGRVRADPGRQYEGDLRRERRGSRAAVSAEHGKGMGDGRVRHAAARDEHAHPARGRGRQGRRTDAGDSTPDRPLAAGGDQSAGARRA